MRTEMKTLVYDGSKKFYGDLKKEIGEGPVAVETNYATLHEVPKELRDQFHLDEVANPSWVDSVTGKFVPGASVPTKANLRALLTGGGALAGVGAGFLAAGPVGAAVGAVVGAGVGAMTGVMTQERVKAHIEIDAKGRLSIKIEPK